MKTIRYLPVWGMILWLFVHTGTAQTDLSLLGDLAEENKKSVEALVLYPSETRLAILQATKNPEILVKMQNMREKTSAAFRALIEDFPRTTQSVFYDLNRYPGLVESLVLQKNDQGAIHKLLQVLPADRVEEAFGIVNRQMSTLIQINDLSQTTRRAFEGLIAGYPISAKQAFTHLLDLPEVIDLLNEDLRFTIMVGDVYRANPAWVIQKMDSLNLVVARAHAEELENWKTSIENDPEAKLELQSAANEYATENGYAVEEVEGNSVDDYAYDDVYADRDPVNSRTDRQIVRHYYDPYPYWYSYPWWEPYPRWHPYPLWWDWGAYFRPRGPIVIYLPSYHFMHWYFDRPQHHDRYNRLSTHFVRHYYGYRSSGTTISTGVRDWQERNRRIISNDFITPQKELSERLREFGRFEQGWRELNTKNPTRITTPEEFLDKNSQKYPQILLSRERAKTEIQHETTVKRERNADWAPPKVPVLPEPIPAPRTDQPAKRKVTPDRKPNLPSNDKPILREPRPAPVPRTKPDEAKDYHRQKWEETSPRKEPRPGVTVPVPKKETRPVPVPKSGGRVQEKQN
jgi:hypothetical protein